MNLLKKYWYFFILGIIIIIIIITKIFNFTEPLDKLKTYLINNGFTTNTQATELQKETSISEEDYENLDTAVYKIESFNYQKNKFNYIYKEKINNTEEIYTMTLNILTGEINGIHTLTNNYDEEWNIKGTYNLSNNEFECNTQGYKGLSEYCDDIKTKMLEYESQVSDYLTASKTSNYYFKYMY